MGTSTVPSLQLQLPKFESLTAGTNLPQVAPEDIEDPPPAPPPPASSTPAADKQQCEDPISPPQSPGGRPTSMRHFLSRVSLNSSYTTNTANHNHGSNDATDKASIFSTPTISSPEAKKSRKSSWWKKASGSSKRHSMLPAAPSHQSQMKVQAIPPPPRLPDDMFGSSMSSMDGDMFKNFK